jgi:hypothetical protein
VVQRPHDGGLVGDLRELRERFGDLDAVDVRVDGLELAANAFGGFGLVVPHVDGRRAAGQPQQDDALGLRLAGGFLLRGGLRFGGKNPGQGEAEDAR